MICSEHETAFVPRGLDRTTDVNVGEIYHDEIELGAAAIVCIECGGTGDWTPFHPEPSTGPHECVECKGTGLIWASV